MEPAPPTHPKTRQRGGMPQAALDVPGSQSLW